MRSILLTSVGVVMWATSPVMADNLSPFEMGPWAGVQSVLQSGHSSPKFANVGTPSSPILIPNKGNATYNGTFAGTGNQGGFVEIVHVTGQSSLTANFGQNTITGKFSGDGSGVCGCGIPTVFAFPGYISLQGSGKITGSTFAFPTLSGTLASHPMPLSNSEVQNSAQGNGSFGGTLAQTVSGQIIANTGIAHPVSFNGTFAAHR